MTTLRQICDLHDIRGCASCTGIEPWEPRKPSEGKVAVTPDYGAGIVVGPDRPAVTFQPQTGEPFEWTPSNNQGKRPKQPWPRRQQVRDRGSKGRYSDRRPTEQAALRKTGYLSGPPPTTTLSFEERRELEALRRDLPR